MKGVAFPFSFYIEMGLDFGQIKLKKPENSEALFLFTHKEPTAPFHNK